MSEWCLAVNLNYVTAAAVAAAEDINSECMVTPANVCVCVCGEVGLLCMCEPSYELVQYIMGMCVCVCVWVYFTSALYGNLCFTV